MGSVTYVPGSFIQLTLRLDRAAKPRAWAIGPSSSNPIAPKSRTSMQVQYARISAGSSLTDSRRGRRRCRNTGCRRVLGEMPRHSRSAVRSRHPARRRTLRRAGSRRVDRGPMLRRKTQSSISVILRARSRVARQHAAPSASRNGKTNGLADTLIRRCPTCPVTAQFCALTRVCGNTRPPFLALASRDALDPRVGASIAVLTERCADRG